MSNYVASETILEKNEDKSAANILSTLVERAKYAYG